MESKGGFKMSGGIDDGFSEGIGKEYIIAEQPKTVVIISCGNMGAGRVHLLNTLNKVMGIDLININEEPISFPTRRLKIWNIEPMNIFKGNNAERCSYSTKVKRRF